MTLQNYRFGFRIGAVTVSCDMVDPTASFEDVLDMAAMYNEVVEHYVSRLKNGQLSETAEPSTTNKIELPTGSYDQLTPEEFSFLPLSQVANDNTLYACQFVRAEMDKGKVAFYMGGRTYPDLYLRPTDPAGKKALTAVNRAGYVVWRRGGEKTKGGFYLDVVDFFPTGG